jgi:hypothetical protein
VLWRFTSSNAADAFGYMAIAYEEPPVKSMAIRRPSHRQSLVGLILRALIRHEAVNGRQSAHDAGPPYVLEAEGAQFGIAGRVLDGPVPKPILDQPRVMARVGHSIAAGMAEHVGVNLEGEATSFANALDEAVDGVSGERPAALRLEHEGTLRIPLQFAQHA